MINIEKIQRSGLSQQEIARQLFPAHKYPDLALSRVVKGRGYLNSEQIKKLAAMLNCRPGDILSEEWSASASKNEITFRCKEYTAKLDTETWMTRIFCNSSLFYEQVIFNGNTPIREYINKLNQIIREKHEN